MSRENLENLLDAMLEESSTRMEAEVERARERQASGAASVASPVPAAELEAPSFREVATLAGLPDPDLRKVLAKAAPDDLLVVLATAQDVLQRRVLANLSAASEEWIRANLAHMDHVSNAERSSAERNVLKAASELARAGEIAFPSPAASANGDVSSNEDVAAAADAELRAALVELVRIARQSGPATLGEVLSFDDTLLSEGLGWVVEGQRGDALRARLAARRTELEAEHARRLRWMEAAIVAIAEGESPDAFGQRLA